jgi:C-terminal processing protease CtpA/Prc
MKVIRHPHNPVALGNHVRHHAKAMDKVRFRLPTPWRPLFGGVAVLLAVGIAADSPKQQLFSEVRRLVDEKYINPFNIDLNRWLNETQTDLDQRCPDPCFPNVAEQVLAERIDSIGDPHFRLWATNGGVEVKQEPVGSSRRTRRFGLLTAVDNNAVTIRFVQPGTNAAATRARLGDQILEVNGVGGTPGEISTALERAESRPEAVTVLVRHSDGTQETLNLQAIKGESWKPSAHYIDATTAVIAVPNLAANDVTDVAVHQLILEAQERGATKMILDLRFADGGSPFAAVKIVGAFVNTAGRVYRDKGGQSITYRYSNGVSTYETSAQPGQKSEIPFKGKFAFWDKPLRVLISESTFSGLENIAAMLQHAKRARVIGAPSRGGGAVNMNPFYLSTGTLVYLSTHRQSELDGSAAKQKVQPDFVVGLKAVELARGRDEQLEAAVLDLK